MSKLTIGADPEVFLRDVAGNYVSAIGLIGGTKKQPRPLERPGFALQEDNVAVEFNIPPSTNVRDFIESIQWSVKRIEKEVAARNLRVTITPAALFPKAELQHPNAKTAGCDPDFNAWTRKRNPRPMVQNGNLRTGAGHVHIGVTEKPKFSKGAFIKSLDLNLGVGSVILDKDTMRKSLYGKAGAFRPTPYGLEYRVLSNFWLTSKDLTEWVYKQTHKAFDMVSEKGEKFFDEIGDEIQACINNSDTKLSKQLLKRYQIALV